MNPRLWAIDLHWLPHAHGALALATLIKKHHPDARVLMGGLSASYFHEELARHPDVDFVVRGDSTEEPVLALVECLREGLPLNDVPNLTWKRRDVVRSPAKLAADVRFISRVSRAPIFVIHDIRMHGLAYADQFLERLRGLRVKNEFVFELYRSEAAEALHRQAGELNSHRIYDQTDFVSWGEGTRQLRPLGLLRLMVELFFEELSLAWLRLGHLGRSKWRSVYRQRVASVPADSRQGSD